MSSTGGRIRDVWAYNLSEEMRTLSSLIGDYSHVALDTEFPGVVARPIAQNGSDFAYQTLRCNVDLLNIIQLGLSLSNDEGHSPEECACWQFNFAFSLSTDMYAQDSIDLLTASGIDFAEHERNGIDVLAFGELLISSGLVLHDDVKWISFHGGYDFAYLLKVLTAVPLPPLEIEFLDMLRLYFPNIYDLKYLMLTTENLRGGLNKVADALQCSRVGTMHQAGSDSLLTLSVFFRMKDEAFSGHISDDKLNHLYGLGRNAPAHVHDRSRSLPQLPHHEQRHPSVQRAQQGSAPVNNIASNGTSHHPSESAPVLPTVTAP